jgi:ubiquinone/menaquinone biosynthesis C-methylase UbiE
MGDRDSGKAKWDHFWTGQEFDGVVVKEDPGNWVDLVWKVALEFWYDRFGQLAPGKRMLECGCGSAKVSQYMALQGYQCTMLDYSEQAIELAKANFHVLSLPGSFVLADLNELGLASNQFDVVYSGGVLHHFKDMAQPIKEMVRVLKPGGLFATNVIPNKFSGQTIADLERTLAHSTRNLVRGRFRDAFKVVSHVPSFYVSPATLKDYVGICEAAGLTSVTGSCTSPFPQLSLPVWGERLYASVMKRLLPQWRRFNQSQSRWTEIWGITYTIYGVKA